ncbi:hypothetical protein acsn021_31090 [Anaerocolumna cellulosilytica]|uniref:Uncharacterized protein n=1 Tax=Anaerocolumna cellulosilytica TaxID=433286 RepID=A0A6S6R7U8_9FIRM|nr:hypothetical protein [Anaerocolumna cellulosilytica]MBB5198131.1 hypothetical protein [Anaerocolumna cellulosilytica]BCJ95540.1 hypothetical protein acsn021_31090 [Anaerocolumna cellulosilytica]
MREEKDKAQMGDNDIFDSSEDVLAMLKNMSSEETSGSSTVEEEDDYFTQFDQESDMDDTDEDLLALLDMISAQDESSSTEEDESILYRPEDTPKARAARVETDSDEVHDDVMAINDMLANGSEDFISNSTIDKAARKSTSSEVADMGDLFSDVLSAVDTLEDKSETNELKGGSRDIFRELEQENLPKSKNAEKERKGFFQKLFSKKDGQKSEDTTTDKIKKKTAVKESKKAVKKSVKAVSKKQTRQEEEDEEDKAARIKKEAALKKKAEMKAANKEKADQKKAAKQQIRKNKAEIRKEKQNLKKEKTAELDRQYAAENPPVKLNKLAVIFVMTFFILVGGTVILGTNAYSYSLGIKNANFNFSRKRYAEAYNQIYGLDIRKADQETYDKIMTVMYVYKQLNSYYNYYQMDEYPKALDSLLKGLDRYDKYKERATELGINADLNYVKEQISKELKDSFHLTEKEIADLRQKDNFEEYSFKVINTALEKMKE